MVLEVRIAGQTGRYFGSSLRAYNVVLLGTYLQLTIEPSLVMFLGVQKN
jgi:hypothetical protein